MEHFAETQFKRQALCLTIGVPSTGSPAHLQPAGSHHADVGPRGRSLLLQVPPQRSHACLLRIRPTHM